MTRLNIIPVGGAEPFHLCSEHCWCNPFLPENGDVIHHAADGREKYERQGIATLGQAWCLVLEVTPVQPSPNPTSP
jgi:hypothetical protein